MSFTSLLPVFQISKVGICNLSKVFGGALRAEGHLPQPTLPPNWRNGSHERRSDLCGSPCITEVFTGANRSGHRVQRLRVQSSWVQVSSGNSTTKTTSRASHTYHPTPPPLPHHPPPPQATRRPSGRPATPPLPCIRHNPPALPPHVA